MEGIVDGRAVDSCFYCGLLYPEKCAEDCPRCGRRMRYRPASILDERELAERIGRMVEALEHAPTASKLVAVLELMHDHAPEAVELAGERGMDIGRLRELFARLTC